MRAEDNGTHHLELHETWWGEWLVCTAAQMRELGIAAGRAFPGERGGGGPRSVLRATDPRGLPVAISLRKGGGYLAQIRYPWLSPAPFETERVLAPGITLRQAETFDEYSGEPSKLLAAGVLTASDLRAMRQSTGRAVKVPDPSKAEDCFGRASKMTLTRRARGRITALIYVTQNEYRRRLALQNEYRAEATAARRPRALERDGGTVQSTLDARAHAARADEAFATFMDRVQGRA